MVKALKYNFPLLVTLFLLLVFYVHNIFPAFNNDDSPETITAAVTMGIQHAPGYPLFTMAGKAFASVFRLPPAFCQNLFSCVIALAVLFAFYFVLAEFLGGGNLSVIPALAGVAVLGLSGPFFSQAICAKGGIYMLNLLLMALSIGACFRISNGAKEKERNLLFFLCGLGMANHWQSAVIYSVVFIIYASRNVSGRKLTGHFLFFILGLTPYIYLLIRSNGGAVMDQGHPSGIFSLTAHILRADYSGEFVPPDLKILRFQAAEFYRAVFASLFMLWPMAIAGFFVLIFEAGSGKKARLPVPAIFVFSSLAVLLLFRRFQDSQCYYLPSLLTAVFMSASAFGAALKLKRRLISYALPVFVAISAAGQVYYSSIQYSGRDNYLSYDYGMNIIKTIPYGGVYFAASGFDTMPLYYFRYVSVFKPDIRVVNSTFLAFPWGIGEFERTFGQVAMEKGRTESNTVNAVKYLALSSQCFCGYGHSTADKTGLAHCQAGITLMAAVSDMKHPFYDVFKVYSYRGIYSTKFLSDGDDFRLISNYAGAMSNYGNDLLRAGMTGSAIGAYTRAIELPYNGSRTGMMKNLFRAYEKSGMRKGRGSF